MKINRVQSYAGKQRSSVAKKNFNQGMSDAKTDVSFGNAKVLLAGLGLSILSLFSCNDVDNHNLEDVLSDGKDINLNDPYWATKAGRDHIQNTTFFNEHSNKWQTRPHSDNSGRGYWILRPNALKLRENINDSLKQNGKIKSFVEDIVDGDIKLAEQKQNAKLANTRLGNFIKNNNSLTSIIKKITDGTASEYKEIKTIEIPVDGSLNRTINDLMETMQIANEQLNRVKETQVENINVNGKVNNQYIFGLLDVPSKNFEANITKISSQVKKVDPLLSTIRLEHEASKESVDELRKDYTDVAKKFCQQKSKKTGPFVNYKEQIEKLNKAKFASYADSVKLNTKMIVQFFLRSKI